MDQNFFVIMAVLFAFFYLIILIFSLLIIIIIERKCQCQSIINLLTCNSCVNLLIYSISSSIQFPLFIQSNSLHLENINRLSCIIFACLSTFGRTLLSYSSVIQAISRFFIIVLDKHRILVTIRVNWMMIIINWIGSAIIAGVLLI